MDANISSGVKNRTPLLATRPTILGTKLGSETSMLSTAGNIVKDSLEICLAAQNNLKAESSDFDTCDVSGSKDVATVPNTYSCMVCNVSFPSRLNVNEHEFSHGTAPNLKCFSCTMTFPTYDLLIPHVRTHTMDQLKNDLLTLAEPSNFKCLLCPEILPNYILLAAHAKKSHKSQHECSQCHHMYKCYSDLKSHILLRHSDLKPFMCSVCGMFFRLNSQLSIHSRIHSNDRFKCPVCDKKFLHVQTLKDHMTKHSNCNAHICTLCGKALASQSSLANHMTIHKNNRPHECKICQKTFRLAFELQVHLHSHSDVRPHGCKECSALFKTSSGLARHIKIHSSVPLFNCTVCLKGFNIKHYLTVHLRTQHTKDKP